MAFIQLTGPAVCGLIAGMECHMPTEPESNRDAGKTEPKLAGDAANDSPQQSSGESSRTPPTADTQMQSASPAQPEQPAQPEESGPTTTTVWKERGKRSFVWGWKIFAELVTVLWTLALWDSYRPKITVSPGPTLDAKIPFSTTFIIQNQGALPIRNISFDTMWTYADSTNQVRNVALGLTKIAKLNSLEQHILVNLPGNTDTNKIPNPVELTPMPIEHHSIILWFDVTYSPQFFGTRTATIYFLGIWDCQTNFVWLPTGDVDIRTEPLDSVLLKRANDFSHSLDLKRGGANITTAQANTNPVTESSSVFGRNGGSQVHTNISSPKQH